jgi:hypothetical protein
VKRGVELFLGEDECGGVHRCLRGAVWGWRARVQDCRVVCARPGVPEKAVQSGQDDPQHIELCRVDKLLALADHRHLYNACASLPGLRRSQLPAARPVRLRPPAPVCNAKTEGYLAMPDKPETTQGPLCLDILRGPECPAGPRRFAARTAGRLPLDFHGLGPASGQQREICQPPAVDPRRANMDLRLPGARHRKSWLGAAAGNPP